MWEMIVSQWPLWLGFNVFVLFILALDLGVFHREAHEVKVKEALTWTMVWIALAMIFNVGLYYYRGGEVAMQFFTGYIIEKSLSVDNIFVFAVIFTYFNVPALYQHRVLFWGILGALALRAIFIFAGVALIHKFHWVIYIFGAFLIFTGIKMILQKDKKMEPDKNPVIRFCRKFLRVSDNFEKDKFFVRQNGLLFVTPLFLVLMMVETTDLIFAVDSIPAILAITDDAFIVYTSNVFAILGLRSLYFALAAFMNSFHYLAYALSAILVFVGIKMLLVDIYKIPMGASLGFILFSLVIAVGASIAHSKADLVVADEPPSTN